MHKQNKYLKIVRKQAKIDTLIIRWDGNTNLSFPSTERQKSTCWQRKAMEEEPLTHWRNPPLTCCEETYVPEQFWFSSDCLIEHLKTATTMMLSGQITRSSGQQRATELTCIWTSQKCLLGFVTGFPQPTSYIHGSSSMSSCPLALYWIIYTMRVRSDAMKACVDGWLGHRQQWLMWVKQLEQWV